MPVISVVLRRSFRHRPSCGYQNTRKESNTQYCMMAQNIPQVTQGSTVTRVARSEHGGICPLRQGRFDRCGLLGS